MESRAFFLIIFHNINPFTCFEIPAGKPITITFIMIRYLLTTAALTLTLAASAVKPTKSMGSGYIYFTPAEFGFDGKPSFFLESSDEFTRITEDMETVETFTLPEQKLTIKKNILIPSGFKYKSIFQQTGDYNTNSLSEALDLIQKFYTQGYVSVSIKQSYIDDDRQVVLFIPGNKIPSGIYTGMTDNEVNYLASEGKLDEIDGYAIFNSGYGNLYMYTKMQINSGELDWSTELKVHSTQTEDTGIPSYFDDVYFLDDIHERIAIITQTLFNHDKDYEVLVPVCKKSAKTVIKDVESYNSISYTYEGPDGEETAYTSKWKEEIYPIEYSGVGVLNLRTGEIMTTFEFPEPYRYSGYKYLSDPDIVALGEKNYLSVSVPSNENYNDYDNYFYELDRNQSGVKTPVIAKKVRVKPGIVNRGENVMVNVEGEKGISAITLTGMNGMTEQRMAGRGEKSSTIATGNLSSGVHIVGVQTADGENSFSKIIVK